ncbi:MAG: hypothetical protein IV101_17010 [Dechloromonas sp.]|uniref:hypothetical protein n=1 Tax=Dechloromonas sp. TaxID=1917218 RepID=UPI0027E829D4|nr:hypothetical protein [Dechloromonas sp.]MBT9522575.1 hypothetical protein [Dechloromonas sp.]
MRFIIPLAAVALAFPSLAQQHDPAMHSQHMAQQQPVSGDFRQAVAFPLEMKEHTLTNMRDHLLALQEIQQALAKAEYDQAAEIAEKRLGMSSLALHGAHEVSKFMPQGMQDAGTAMHRGASRFGVAARDVAVTGDLKPAIGALSEVMGACVACHAGYRLK